MPYENDKEEIKLIKGCLQNNADCQKKLFKKYYSKMLGICIRYAADYEEARDILQDVFIKVFDKLHQYNFDKPFSNWISRITVNTAIDQYRINKLKPVKTNLEFAENNAPVDIISTLDAAELVQLLNKLPAGYRTIFNLYIIEGYTHKEIAEKLNIETGTSKSQLHKARAYFHQLVKIYYDER